MSVIEVTTDRSEPTVWQRLKNDRRLASSESSSSDEDLSTPVAEVPRRQPIPVRFAIAHATAWHHLARWLTRESARSRSRSTPRATTGSTTRRLRSIRSSAADDVEHVIRCAVRTRDDGLRALKAGRLETLTCGKVHRTDEATALDKGCSQQRSASRRPKSNARSTSSPLA